MEHKITVYSTSTCAACKQAKAFITEKGFEYENKDVGEDAKAREEMMTKNGGIISVPTIEIDGQIIIGYDAEKIESALQ